MYNTYRATATIPRHCQQCGSTDPEDINTLDDDEFQGYTRCCNERSVTDHVDCSHTTRTN